MKLFERLLDSDAKADLLTLYHNNPTLSDTVEGLAKRIGRSPEDVRREIEDLLELGLLRRAEVYSFASERDKELIDAISKQLALGQAAATEDYLTALSGLGSQVSRIVTGLDILDQVLPDGLPAMGTVLVLSDPGAREENLIAYFVSQHIQNAKSVLYLTLDNFPDNIRLQLQLRKESIDPSSLVFVDCYSKAAGAESTESRVVDPGILSAISIAVSEVMGQRNISLIVLDSFNTLIRKSSVRSAIEFLHVLVARARQARCLSLVSMNRKAFHPAIVASAQDIVDGVIELKVEESQEGIVRSLRVLKMLRAKYITTWTAYEVSDDGKLVQVRRAKAGAAPKKMGRRSRKT